MEIEKAYFTLPEILDRWSISEADLIYLAENDKLRLSVRVFGVPLELGDYEETDDGRALPRADGSRAASAVCSICMRRTSSSSSGAAKFHLSDFRTPRASYATLYGEADADLRDDRRSAAKARGT